MINLEQLSKGFVIEHPMKIGIFHNLLSLSQQNELLSHYPSTGFEAIQRAVPPGKLYAFSLMPLFENGQRINSQSLLHDSWGKFITSLLDVQYRETLARVLDLDLSDAHVNIGLYQFNANDYVDVHLDREDKVVTQIFYFNTHWDVSNGGFLQLLYDQEPRSCFLSLPPLSIYSVAIVRGDKAWHAVQPISPGSKQARLSLQLEFYR